MAIMKQITQNRYMVEDETRPRKGLPNIGQNGCISGYRKASKMM
jgi:hypothetical protein